MKYEFEWNVTGTTIARSLVTAAALVFAVIITASTFDYVMMSRAKAKPSPAAPEPKALVACNTTCRWKVVQAPNGQRSWNMFDSDCESDCECRAPNIAIDSDETTLNAGDVVEVACVPKGTPLPVICPGSICAFTWSPTNRRWTYAFGCTIPNGGTNAGCNCNVPNIAGVYWPAGSDTDGDPVPLPVMAVDTFCTKPNPILNGRPKK